MLLLPLFLTLQSSETMRESIYKKTLLPAGLKLSDFVHFVLFYFVFVVTVEVVKEEEDDDDDDDDEGGDLSKYNLDDEVLENCYDHFQITETFCNK